MKRFIWSFLLISGIAFPAVARGEDVTLLLTLKAEIKESTVKNELRIGLWQEGKDGFDPQDVEAMTNGLFDAYFEIPSENGNSFHDLWWDIRSLNPSQEWKLQIKSPPEIPITLEWKQLSLSEGSHRIMFVFFDPDTGHETDLNPSSGSLQLLSHGTKTITIKSLIK